MRMAVFDHVVRSVVFGGFMFYGKKWLMVFICIWGLCRGVTVYAQEADLTSAVIIAEGFQKNQSIADGNRGTYSICKETGSVEISSETGIAGIYVEFDRIPTEWTVTNPADGTSITCGKHGMLHEFADVVAAFGSLPQTLLLEFPQGTVVADVYAFGEGELPAFVQNWEPPCEEADLLLLTSHSDDEQLFFSGVLPYYAGERGLQVQVAYVVQHFEANGVQNHVRPHELLDGLWTVGVRHYPVMSEFPDLYAESKDREKAFNQAIKAYESAGIAYTDFLGYIIECLRRFKPLVVVSHDLDGEYGHGAHVVCAQALTEAIALAADEKAYPESFEKYGVWETEKVYLHLYEENPIVMDWDVPLEHFGGKTAFEVSQEGFGCHKSQHWTWFYKWMYGNAERPIKKAVDIRSYSPCHYGLFYTKNGLDTMGGDFLENVVTYEERRMIAEREAEEKRLAELEAQKAAEEAKKAEEEAAKKAEEERLKQQEAEQKQEEALLAEAVRQAEAAEKEALKKRIYICGVAGGILLVGIIVSVIARRRNRRESYK